MKEMGLRSKLAKKFKVTTDSKHNYLIMDNNLNRHFEQTEPSKAWGSDERFYDWMGIKDSDKVLAYWGGHVVESTVKDKMKSFFNNYLKNTFYVNAYDTRPETYNTLLNILTNKNIKLIRSYPQVLYNLALKLKRDKKKFSIKAIMTTAEPLMPQHRELFREVFGAECFDQYGCGEIGALAYECNEHKGLHVTEERVIIETNDKDELLLTDLDNYAMPYIRYWNADQALFSDKECSCGRKSKLIKEVLGRTSDYLIGVNGETLHWAFFWHLFFDTKIAEKRNFKKFQVVQKTKDFLLFRTVGDELTFDDKEVLTTLVREKMGDMKIEFTNENDIENSKSGKYRPVINEIL